MAKRISKRLREEAALICALCASGRDFAVYTFEAAEWIRPDASRRYGAWCLAFDLVDKIQHERIRRDGPGGWRREDYAEAEAMLRTGWTP